MTAFTAGNYWSSTENDASNAWNQNFDNGNQNRNNKTNSYHGRAVRILEPMSTDFFTPAEVFQAYFDCRKNKRYTDAQLTFEMNLRRNLVRLYEDLNSGHYKIGRSKVFVISYPKWREVWASSFRDRIVHHIIVNRIAPGFHRRFIHDTYACVPNGGPLKGARRVQRFMRQATENWQKKAHFLQADLANFFVSIRKDILLGLVLERVTEEPLRRLITQVYLNDPTINPIIKSPRWKFEKVPWHKSLFHANGNGLAIGDQSSQLGAGILLNPMDQFIKRTLGIRWYGRYVDDIVMIDEDPQRLNAAFERIQQFAETRLAVKFHPEKTQRNTVDKGINFAGYIIKPHRIYVRRRTVHAMQQVAHSDERHTDPQRWQSRMNSYLGVCRHANTYSLRKQLAIDTGATFAPNLTKVKATKRKAS